LASHNHSLLALFDLHQRIEIEFPGTRKDHLPELVRFVRPAPGMSFILYSKLNGSNAGAAIQKQIAYFTQLNQPFEWKVYDHDTPPDLKDRLAAQDFTIEGPDAVMVLDLSHAPTEILKPQNADLRPITRRDELGAVITIEEQVWGGSFAWITERLGSHLEIPGYLNVLVAYADGQPACAGWVYFHPHSPFGDLWGGSTVPSYRKRGLYTAVLAWRVQEALRRGYRYLTIDASPMSRPILEKYGFQVLAYAYDCEWHPCA
jgi:GNAT superfamily N-acetyltransferase